MPSPKDFYHDLLIPELFRYAKLRSMDPEQLDEDGAAIYSVWYTQNAGDHPERGIFCNLPRDDAPVIINKTSARKLYGDVRLGEIPKPKRRPAKTKGIRFTVHTHPGEPLTPSPDDLAVYHYMDAADENGEPMTHFITDGFLCRKVDLDEL